MVNMKILFLFFIIIIIDEGIFVVFVLGNGHTTRVVELAVSPFGVGRFHHHWSDHPTTTQTG